MTAFLRMIWTIVNSMLTVVWNLLTSAEWSVRWMLRIMLGYFAILLFVAGLGNKNSVFWLTILFFLLTITVIIGPEINIPRFGGAAGRRNRQRLGRWINRWTGRIGGRAVMGIGIVLGLLILALVALGFWKAPAFTLIFLVLLGILFYKGFSVPRVPILPFVILNQFRFGNRILGGIGLFYAICLSLGAFFSVVEVDLSWRATALLFLLIIAYLLFLHAAGAGYKLAAKGAFVTGWVIVITFTTGIIGWENIRREASHKTAVIRKAIVMKEMPRLHEVTPSLAGVEPAPVPLSKNEILNGEIVVMPQTQTQWIDRPGDSYRFMWDVPTEVADLVDTEREYADGSVEIKNCAVEERKPIARVRFIHKGKRVPIKVKVWSTPNPA